MKRIDDVWDACPESELAQLAIALRQTNFHRQAYRFSAAIAVALVCLTALACGFVFFRR